jgi:hypothetical protein
VISELGVDPLPELLAAPNVCTRRCKFRIAAIMHHGARIAQLKAEIGQLEGHAESR